MKTYDCKPLQCFVTPEIHRAIKMRAADSRTTIDAIMRDLITDYCTPHTMRDEPPAGGAAPK